MHFKKQKESKTLDVDLRGYELLRTALLNKGMAFPNNERIAFNLLGLLPPTESTLEEQCTRSYQAFRSKNNDLERYIYLRDLQDSNETLFYALLLNYIEEMLPIVYTPTVGAGCQQFSHIYRHPRGLYLAYPYLDKLDSILANTQFNDVRAIVVSDGERILGLGDQGAGGMGIPIGKLSLYTACAGIHPSQTLPILLDTGTNNPDLLNDPLYIGWRHERVRGQEYDDFIESFVNAIKKRFPHVLLQWEDFAKLNASRILESYQTKLCTFNDDIQGTAAVTVGTILAALHITKVPLTEQRVVIFGAGSAGTGIGKLIVAAMKKAGLSETAANSAIYLVDRNGLLTENSHAQAMSFQKQFLQSNEKIAHWKCDNPSTISLKDIIYNVKPTILVGVSGQGHAFTEDIVKLMASGVERPIIFPLSNPTAQSEATPQDLMAWTNDKAIVSTGSPFGTILREGIPFRVDQTNNVYIFPGMGLGLIAAQATEATDDMFMIAAQVLADCSPAHANPNANLLPTIPEVRQVSYSVAYAVAKEAIEKGLSPIKSTENLDTLIKEMMWTPAYWPYHAV